MKKILSVAVATTILSAASFANANAVSDRINSATDTDFSYTFVELDYDFMGDFSGPQLNGSIAILKDKSWGGLSLIGSLGKVSGDDNANNDIDTTELTAGALYHLNAGKLFKKNNALTNMDFYASAEIQHFNIDYDCHADKTKTGLLLKNGVRFHVTEKLEVFGGWNYTTTLDNDLYWDAGARYAFNKTFAIQTAITFAKEWSDENETDFTLGGRINF
jgi:opacity protein-like surface antigen